MLITIKMHKDIEKVIEIPSGYQLEINGGEVLVKHSGKENKKIFSIGGISITKEGNQVKVIGKRATKKEAKLIGSAAAHIRNMIGGMDKQYEYKLEVCNVHFPMVLKVEGSKVIIKNFLGEQIDRSANIVPDSKVEVKGNIIHVTSHNKESASQTAANIEIATKIKSKDRRIFQDGIFTVERNGVKL